MLKCLTNLKCLPNIWKQLLLLMTALSGIPGLWVIINAVNRFLNNRNLRKRLPSDYTLQLIKMKIQYYIWPDCQSVDPAQSDEVRHTVAVRHDLCSTMDRLLKEDTIHKHYILLADTGMGKTSFLLNYFASHLRRLGKKSFNMEFVPLAVPGLQERLKKVRSPENTVLLLDAFDEDSEAIQDHVRRIGDIMQWTRDFYRVVITCRTQFFPRDEEMPVETGIIKAVPRGLGEGPQFTFYKIYLSPFSDKQVQAYLNRRFPIWQKDRRQQARHMVDKIPNLAVRPLVLTYIDDLINSGKSFANCYQIYTVVIDGWLERERAFVKDKESLYEFSNKLAVELFANLEKGQSDRIHYSEIEPLAKQFDINLATWQLTGRSLLNRDAEGNYKFAHRSFMEFLFAHQLIEGNQKALQIPARYWTEQVKSFLFDKYGKNAWEFPIAIKFAFFFVSFQGGTFQFSKTGKAVEVRPFAMSIYPVTNQEYEEFDPSHRVKRDQYSDQDDQPVVHVSWKEANSYCQWLSKETGKNYRLPTEAEWEFAASGGSQRQYPWGNEEPTPERANYKESKIGKTTPVGSYPLGMTPEGLFDMAGNVWEWCDDWYDDEDKKGFGRVVRGGSFILNQYNLRCAARGRLNLDYRNFVIGFRLVCGPSV